MKVLSIGWLFKKFVYVSAKIVVKKATKYPIRYFLFWAKFDLTEANPISKKPFGEISMNSKSTAALKSSVEMNERKRDTRRKILIGSFYLKKAKQENKINELRTEMLAFLTREIDRDLFNDA